MKKLSRLFILAAMLAVFIGCTSYVSAMDYVDDETYSATRADKINSFLNDSRWKDNTAWNGQQKPIYNKDNKVDVGCGAYASDFIKYVYGKTDMKEGCAFTDVSEIQAGDIIWIATEELKKTHYFVVLKRYDDGSLLTAEGNFTKNKDVGPVVRITDTGYYIDEVNNRIEGDYISRQLIAGWHFENGPVTYTDATTVSVSCSKKYVPVGDSITFNFSGNNNGVYTVTRYKKDSNGYGNLLLPSPTFKGDSYTFTPDAQASYYIYVTAYGKSSVKSSKIEFVAYKSGHTHSWKTESVAAGYLKDGYSRERCQYCGTTRNYVKKPGYSTSYVKNFTLARGTRSITAKWTKRSSTIQAKFTGYQVKYATTSSMSNAKYVTVSKSASYKKISKLKSKKRYYVKVRTYKTVSGKKYYSKWSTMKYITTR